MEATNDLLKFAMADLNRSARTYDRMLKMARTIADLAGHEDMRGEHISGHPVSFLGSAVAGVDFSDSEIHVTVIGQATSHG